MLQFGKSITTPGDMLQPLTVERLFHALINPKQEFRDRIEQLRMVRSMDEGQYRQLKKQLPYFVCGIFHPSVRRKENFASISCFMLDLDHLMRASLDLSVLRERMREVPEVMLCFASPSGDGLKLMFRLSEPCRDSALFSAFYKLFARRFGEKWGLLEAMDFQTSDVTRACFLSVDPDAFFRPDAQPLDISAFIPELDFGKAEKEIQETEKVLKAQGLLAKPPKEELGEDVLQRIKQKLSPNMRPPKEKQYFVPEQVDEALGLLSEKLADYEMQIVETAPIHYGRKIKVKAGLHWAEINLFYGKQGYKVVKTTKSGSHAELADLAADAMTVILEAL